MIHIQVLILELAPLVHLHHLVMELPLHHVANLSAALVNILTGLVLSLAILDDANHVHLHIIVLMASTRYHVAATLYALAVLK